MNKIKAVVFGLRNLLIEEVNGPDGSTGRLDRKSVHEFGRLLRLLKLRDIEPILFANDHWYFTKDKSRGAEEALGEEWGMSIRAFFAARDNMPRKPRAEAMAELLRRIGCTANEVLYIGNNDDDMRTAVNGEVLFLNGTWLKDACTYGFKFQTVKDVARFIDVFCVRRHDWEFKLETDSGLRYFALAPFSTMMQQYEEYSASARNLAKGGIGDPIFWGRYLCASLFLSGLHSEIDYACPFPSHQANTWNDPLKSVVDSFTKCFRAKYLPDLVVRHKTALQSHKNRAAMSHLSHLETLRINRAPIKNAKGDRYKNPPLDSKKTVLILDDICTRGYSLEAGRILTQVTGAKVITVSWLKTINTPFVEISAPIIASPYGTTTMNLAGQIQTRSHPYTATITDAEAYKELAQRHAAYETWDWPAGC